MVPVRVNRVWRQPSTQRTNGRHLRPIGPRPRSNDVHLDAERLETCYDSRLLVTGSYHGRDAHGMSRCLLTDCQSNENLLESPDRGRSNDVHYAHAMVTAWA